ncbi:TonB-dependent receptor [Sanguibacteroides justesenii]|uniref:TonB-dependent receptor n=1 Tax=Sanguibacteroides justesenii TaxID=1547597 RepID=A0A0C3M8V8_9PORP|nr:TonB-dependent receptor [Sanguibacteroides justesenii]KIO42843.1 TonB-dependent receptor [Sanguibacteroides justesenii]KIO45039.1 TonB-dependent receptor [Sanguibacteroides justesenii]PXZ44159.1 TonB-dependent receptor [Sanguibacteroides justesenii]
MKIRRILLFLFFNLFLFSSFAQEKGVVKGRVVDRKNNEPIPFANVIIWKTTIGVTTDTNGYFRIEKIPLGFNRLEVSSLGYKTILSEEFMVNTASEKTINIELEESSFALDQVTIKADPFRKTSNSPISLQRIGIAEIEKNPGGNRDISKVLQSMPGVLSSPAFRNDFIVRGGGPSENRFYLDNVEIPNLNHFATQGSSGGVVSIINVDFVKEVDFYAGAFPASRGNLMSSLLEFKQIAGNPDKLKFRGTLGATDFGLSIDGPLTPKTTFIASARRSYLKMLFNIIGLPFLPVYNDFQFKTETTIDGKDKLTVIGIGAYDVNHLNKGMKHPDDNQKYLLRYLPESKQWSYTIGITYRHYGKHWNNLFVLSRSTLQNEIEKYTDNNQNRPKSTDYSSGETENKFRFEHQRLLKASIQLNLGTGIEHAAYKNKTVKTLFTQGDISSIHYNHDFHFFKWSFFGQASKIFGDEKLTLSLGIRADGNNYSSDMQNPFKQLSPRFSLSYGLTPFWYINFNVGRYYQLPSYTTMGYANAEGLLVNKDNHLKYISTDHYVAGIEFRIGDLTRITLESFYKKYDHYPVSLLDSIVLANKGTDYVAVGDEPVKSSGEGRAYGIEFMLRTQKLFGLTASVAYTYYYSEFKKMDKNFRPTSVYIPSSWDNRHIFSLTAIRKFGNWDIGMKWRYANGAPSTPYDAKTSSLIVAWDAKHQPYYDYSRFNSERASAFHQLDIRVDRSFYFHRWSLILYADIQNIYNHKTKSPDLLVPAENPDGSYIVDKNNPDHYIMRYIKNDTGTLLPSIGIIIDF